MKNSIPKIIHYCWISDEEYPDLVKKCMDSWKKYLPDYEFIKWDSTNFDMKICEYTKQAYEAKKYTWVSDYIRLYALYHIGGIYLDCDIEVVKNFDQLLENKGFTCFETEKLVAAWIFGSQKGNPIFKQFLDYYDNSSFIKENGEYDLTANPVPITKICCKNGLKLNGKEQNLGDLVVYPMTYFCPYNPYRKGSSRFTKKTYAIHWFNGSWLKEEEKKRNLMEKKYVDLFGKKIGKKIAAFIFYKNKEGINRAVKISVSKLLKREENR